MTSEVSAPSRGSDTRSESAAGKPDTLGSDVSVEPEVGYVRDDAAALRYALRGIPAPLAGRQTLTLAEQRAHNTTLRELLTLAHEQLQRNHAQMVLMDGENRRLRELAFRKTNKAARKEVTGMARHMTGDENLRELERADWETKMLA